MTCYNFSHIYWKAEITEEKGSCKILYDKGKGTQVPNTMTTTPCTSVSANSWENYKVLSI